MIELEIVSGAAKGQQIKTGATLVPIGRSPENTLLIADPFVSRHHGEIALLGGRYQYRDLNSTHGTILRRGKIENYVKHAIIQEGDELLLGATENVVRVKGLTLDAAYADNEAVTIAHSPDESFLPPADVFAEDAKALQTLLRFDEKIMTATLTTRRQLLHGLIDQIPQLFEGLEYAAILEWSDGEVNTYDYVILEPEAKVRRSRTLLEKADALKDGFVFKIGRQGLLRSAAEEAPVDGSSLCVQEGKGDSSGICVPIPFTLDTFKYLQFERPRGYGVFTSHELALVSHMVSRVRDRIANLTLVRQNQRLNASASLGVFAAMIGHDIKNYLFYGKKLSEIMTEPLVMHPGILRGLERARKLAQGMKDLAAPGEVALKEFSIKDLVESIAQEFRSLFGERCAFRAVIERDFGAIRNSEDLLSRTVWNLVMNAYSTAEARGGAMPACPEIDIIVSETGPMTFSIEIRDNAGGIGPRTLEYIRRSFELIGRVYNRQEDLMHVVNEISAMTGFTNSVGLFFTAVAVNDMNGRIDVATELGQGTSFVIMLPKRLDALRNLLRF